MEQGLQQGLEQGLEQGQLQAKRAIARQLIKENIASELILRATGLSREEIHSLQQESET